MRRLFVSLAREMLCKFLVELFGRPPFAVTRRCLHTQNAKMIKRDTPKMDATAMATMTDVVNIGFDTPSAQSKTNMTSKGYPKKKRKRWMNQTCN